MAYDPQAKHRRPRPADGPAPVDALLGDRPTPPVPPPTGVADDPPPVVAVTPAPADPPPDALLIRTGVAAVVGGLLALLTLRHLWLRHRRRAAAEAPTD